MLLMRVTTRNPDDAIALDHLPDQPQHPPILSHDDYFRFNSQCFPHLLQVCSPLACLPWHLPRLQRGQSVVLHNGLGTAWGDETGA